MATDFFWSYTDEPHASRRRQIPYRYPQIRQLFGPDPWAFLKIALVVILQLSTAAILHNSGWLKILAIGSFLNHNLFLAIHELSHNLAFSTPVYNRWLGIFANLPIGVPMSVTFQKYHLEHHEHYVFNPNQETYSYYGPLNLLTWGVGYHNEHHEFPRIPGNKLHLVKEIAGEYYEGLES
ncbi:hypothetical protein ARALYDRAFT_911754 [Arabidopsis lyrata subsp. lyrata]|uniref:Sphingolipid delta4-desaturase N-terminal domain-containing protein n=1 Tax=Arabidopsis lyrata subsp. lyrata TaxID=81972 RepID=D7M1V4_ARALL|nr:hypothetical protein ARALYDRAFT_911754 [Arabidopsis lyrata subsp. lyrata]